MSGVKRATVTNSLNKTMSLVRESLKQCAERAEKIGNTGKKDLDRKRADAERIEVIRELPPELREFLKGETAQWESLVRRHDETLKDAGQMYSDASEKLKKYESKKTKFGSEIDSIQKKADAIRFLLQGKDWYCDFENDEAKDLRRKAEKVVHDLEGHAHLCTEAQGIAQKCFAKYSESENLAQLAQNEYKRLINLGNDRKEKERIREENERNAKCLAGDLRSLKERIESRDFNKFGGGAYSSAEQKLLDSVEALVSAEKYEQALKEAGDLKARLVKAAEKIEDAQLAWETAKAAAEKVLVDAKEEIAGFNREDITMYSGMDAGTVQAAFDEVDAAEKAIRAEKFEVASTCVSHGIQKIRAIVETTVKNKEMAKQRLKIAKCIKRALIASNYDEPKAYLDDNENELSMLNLVAPSPNRTGDMELHINLDGSVSFEVKNIPEGQEQLCKNAVRGLKDKLWESGLEFSITDRGRAEDWPGSQRLSIPTAVETDVDVEVDIETDCKAGN